MTLTEFAIELKILLREAEDAGLKVEEFCAIAEHILSTGWSDDNERAE